MNDDLRLHPFIARIGTAASMARISIPVHWFDTVDSLLALDFFMVLVDRTE